MSERVALFSCGGGRQSAGITALICQGRLPRPDHVCMVALEWEMKATYRYVCDYIRPAFRRLGVPFTFVSRKKYAECEFWAGADGETLMIPAYSDQSGVPSKLSEFCSGKWKQRVVRRWAAEQLGWKQRGIDNWIGITWEERRRRRGPQEKWLQPVYPLLDILPMHVSGCLAAVERMGWPEPPRSRCHHCPNQSDAEWAELTPAEWESACKLDEEIRQMDSHAFLHKQLIPLRMVTLNPKDDNGGLFGGCSSGTCY